MDTWQFLLTKTVEHFSAELLFVAGGIILVLMGRQTQRVPEFHPLNTSQADRLLPQIPGTAGEQLVEFGFQPAAKFEVSMNASVAMIVEVFLAADHRCLAAVVQVRSATEIFSFVEFDSNLSPHGNITTSNSKQANIFYRPPDKMIAKVPWKKNVAALFSLHQELCETATCCGFTPVAIKPESLQKYLVQSVRGPFEDQVKCGRMVKVGINAYRASFKGALIFVPLVWHKKVYGCFYHLIRPANQTFCATLTKRLQQARLMREPYGGQLAMEPGRMTY